MSPASENMASAPGASTGGHERHRGVLFILCVCAGAAPFAARWIQGGVARFSCLTATTVLFLVLAWVLHERPAWRKYWELPFAFFILSLVQLLNGLVPYFRTYVLHQPTVPGNPLASTVLGTVVIQLLETFIALVPILVLTKVSGKPLGSVYARKGRLGALFVLSALAFAAMAIVMARHAGRFTPTNGSITLDRYLALSPALFVLVVSNGFQEEFLFRGLFLQKYQAFFSARVAIVLQAIVFSVAHVGIGYSSSATLFIVLFVFPLGLITGYLMHATKGVLTPAIFHAGVDIPIYLAFLSYVSK
jgi:membrane protease YdiL (CAAX protease family)